MPLVLRHDHDKPLPPILRGYLDEMGWRTEGYDDSCRSDRQWNVWWRSTRFTPDQLSSGQYPHQRLNHFPKTNEITKKDSLLRNIKRMRGVYGSLYDILPTTYVLPGEHAKFARDFDEFRRSNPRTAWICKPSELSRGRKIYVFRELAELVYDCPVVVQRYIDRPLLLSGYKFDLRVYVLVTSYSPLRVYVFQNFMVRFSTERYDITDLTNVCAHLTNTSLNKKSKGFSSVKEGIGEGCKWDGPQFVAYLDQFQIPMSVLWTRIENVINLTLLSIAQGIPHNPMCFELYGFDLLFDYTFKPWLLEVNFCPALQIDGPVDERVKSPLIRDLFDTLNIPSGPAVGSHDATSVSRKAKTKPDLPQAVRRSTPPMGSTVPRKPTSPTVTSRGSRDDRLAATQKRPSFPAHPRGIPQFVDRPRGQFKLVFPFSPTTEEASLHMAYGLDRHPTGDTPMKSILMEIKKKESAAAQQCKPFPDRYEAPSTTSSSPDSLF